MSVETTNPTGKPGALEDFFMRMGILGELFAFLWKRKLYWLIPMMLTLMVVAVLIIVAGSGTASVFLYPIFG